MTAHYILSAIINWKGMPRDYCKLSNFLGVGPKIFLVCIAVCYGNKQGAPCNVHMVQIFEALGWVSVEQYVEVSSVKMKKERDKKGNKNDNEY
jgi:endonuclease III